MNFSILPQRTAILPANRTVELAEQYGRTRIKGGLERYPKVVRFVLKTFATDAVIQKA